MGKTLSIETGIRCSNRCTFCYQFHWRSGGNRLPDPPLKDLVAKLTWGRENGYDQVGFSGGEPTVRKDFLDLVKEAKRLGYTRVSLTTNGRRFARLDYALEALESGIDSIGFSLHGANRETHDTLVGRQGAFDQLLAGLANINTAAARLRRKVDENLFVLVNRQNHMQLADICRIGRAHGIKLMIMQPVIYSKGNLGLAANHHLPLPQLLDAIGQAAQIGLTQEWFVKLFNLPVCFFADSLQAFEHQRYPVDIFRYQERRRAGESRLVAGQGYFRLDRCQQCVLEEFCPGLHQSLVSADQLTSVLDNSLTIPSGGKELWLAGLDLFDAPSLTALFRTLRQRHPVRPLRLYHSGDSVAGEAAIDAALAGGVDRISLVYTGLEKNGTELTARSGGNAGALLATLQHRLLRGPHPLGISLAIPYVDSATPDDWQEVMRFAGAGCDRLEIQLPWDFKNPEVFEFAKFFRLGRAWRNAGGRDWEVVVPNGDKRGTGFFRLPASLVSTLSNAAENYAHHFFASSKGAWAAASIPAFARRQGRPDHDPTLTGLPGRPIDEELLNQMRPG